MYYQIRKRHDMRSISSAIISFVIFYIGICFPKRKENGVWLEDVYSAYHL